MSKKNIIHVRDLIYYYCVYMDGTDCNMELVNVLTKTKNRNN